MSRIRISDNWVKRDDKSGYWGRDIPLAPGVLSCNTQGQVQPQNCWFCLVWSWEFAFLASSQVMPICLFEKRPHSGSPRHTIQMMWLLYTIIWKLKRAWLIKTFRLRAFWKILFRSDFAFLMLWSTQRLLVFELILLVMFIAFHFSEIWKPVSIELCK